MDKFTLPKRFQSTKSSVWSEYTLLALKYNPVNLGLGFPDFLAPQYVRNALTNVSQSENPLLNQYTRTSGHPRLVHAIGELYSNLIRRNIDPFSEILVTCGAYDALYTTIVGNVEAGDEVIIIEPYFDCYDELVRVAEGVPRFIPLRPTKTKGLISSADWVLDQKELETLFNERTKMIIVNSPHNPVGKVFKRQELEKIAELCKKWNVLCVSDEVYEWMVYDDAEHIRMCTLPGMWERTITICSGGKTFSVTGWKTGWAYGPAHLMHNLQVVHQTCVSSCPTPTQEAVAECIELETARLDSPECYFNSLPKLLSKNRDLVAKFLQDAGMKPTIPEGGYFMLADWSPLESKVDMESETDELRDFRFTKWMIKNKGLQGIPSSTFYSEASKPMAENHVRYCFAKKEENLQKAKYVFENWK